MLRKVHGLPGLVIMESVWDHEKTNGRIRNLMKKNNRFLEAATISDKSKYEGLPFQSFHSTWD